MSDLIERRAIRDAMYHEAFEKDSDEQKWDGGCWIRYKMFERIVESLPSAQPEQRWIPVTERLPEPNEEDELGFIKAYLVQDGRWMDVARWNGGFWVAWGYGTVVKDVTAWMPLPEPWKGERDE